MFATLLGALPRPPLPASVAQEELVRAAIGAQTTVGLEPLTDGGWWGDRPAVEAWRATSAMTERAVKQVVLGPLSGGDASPSDAARGLNAVLLELAGAGCPLIEVHEPALTTLGDDPGAWGRFADAHAILTDGVTGTHLSLAIVGGSVDPAGIPAVIAAPYASLAVDLIAGPENWRLVRAAPGARGIVCGALSPQAGSDDGPETLLWAAAYAASGDGRGRDRVGLATAGSLADLPWEAAVTKLERLGAAVRLASLSPDELRRRLDPRAIDARSAALGTAEPVDRPRRSGAGGHDQDGDR
jgi:hypothetical protein